MSPRPMTRLALTAALLCGCGGALADEPLLERTLTWDQLPQSVAQTLQQALGDHQAEEIEEIVIEGVVVLYEAEFHMGGREIEIAIHPNGELAHGSPEDDDDMGDDDDALDGDDAQDDAGDEAGEHDVTCADLPPAARRSLQRLIGDHLPDEIEAITYEGFIVGYEIEIEWAGDEIDEGGDDDEDAHGRQGDRRDVEFFLYPYGGVAQWEGEEVVERQVTIDDIPAGIAEKIQREMGGRLADEIEEVRYEGLPILYEAEYDVAGTEYEVAVLPTGEVLRKGPEGDEPYEGVREREIGLDKAPAAVAETIRRHFGDATLEIDEIGYEGDIVLYDAESGEMEISVYPDGTLAAKWRDSGDDDAMGDDDADVHDDADDDDDMDGDDE